MRVQTNGRFAGGFFAVTLALATAACGGADAPTEGEQAQSELAAAQCRSARNANERQCRLEGNVQSTLMDDEHCVLFVTQASNGRVYGLVEDATATGEDRCPYTRRFHGLGAQPFSKVWTRFADTKTVSAATKRAIVAKDPRHAGVTFYSLEGPLRGEMPAEGAADLRRSIEAAITPLGGPQESLTQSITKSEAPQRVRAKLAAAEREIQERTFEGTDYVADVEGFYVIYASTARTEIVGYAVYGRGAGEPDYQDGIVIVFDGDGNRIYDETESG